MKKNHFRITLSANGKSLEGLLPLLQYGVEINVDAGLTVATLLTGFYGIDPRYVERFISTIFLDGKPVDDPAAALLREGAVLALSGAMPGLVGAVLRSGSILGSFRHSITHHDSGGENVAGKVTLTVKLFNRVMREAGAAFLSKGILLPAALLAGHLRGMDELFWQGISSGEVGGNPYTGKDLRDAVSRLTEGKIHLSVSLPE